MFFIFLKSTIFATNKRQGTLSSKLKNLRIALRIINLGIQANNKEHLGAI